MTDAAPPQGTEATAQPAEYPWRCFHCGDVFHDEASATEHFGKSEHQQPACQIDVAEYRRMEETNRRHCEEDTDLHREIHRITADHYTALRREEEAGYTKGLKDGRDEALASLPEPTAAALPVQGARIEPQSCAHMNFDASVRVARIEDIGRFVAEVTIKCAGCGVPFQFLGIEPGFNYEAPTVGLDGLEANLPIFPQGVRPTPLQGLQGYTFKGTN